MTTNTNEANKYKTLAIKHTFDANREVVWQAWTDPMQFAEWWSPDGFTVPVCELDVQPNGKLRVDMKGPDGTIYPSVGVYKEVIEPERLSFTNIPLDNEGNELFEVLQTLTLIENGNKTDFELTAEVLSATPEAAPYLSGMEPGLKQALGKLDTLLNSKEVK
jgi:uncharacterized protein YndB with AHSA1/START domain